MSMITATTMNTITIMKTTTMSTIMNMTKTAPADAMTMSIIITIMQMKCLQAGERDASQIHEGKDRGCIKDSLRDR